LKQLIDKVKMKTLLNKVSNKYKGILNN